ncbi:Flp1 family type IVb pilin [Cohnella lupini]|uniref:Putative flagellin with Flp1-like domain n=1 Tax=Cohnella lupini TaxID=1294267 RepID=A0A3D9IML3_9BACL|nr:Flp1 family type IVb pilin [Cohnella lupini]RED63020.1 putative flagellin with Flp1-like domain [Cohnella lupini]
MKRLVDGMKRFWKNEQGIGTLEIILIIAVIVIIAVVFKDYIISWVKRLLEGTDEKLDGIDPSADEGIDAPNH